MATLSFKDFSQGKPAQVVGNEQQVQQKETESGKPSFFEGLSRVASVYGKNLKEQAVAGVENTQKTIGMGVDTMQQAQQMTFDTQANKDAAFTTATAGAAQVGVGAMSGLVQTAFSPITAGVLTAVQGYKELDEATGGNMKNQLTQVAQSNPELVKSISDYVVQNPKKVQFASDMLNVLTAGVGGKMVGEATKDLTKEIVTGTKEVIGAIPAPSIPNVIKKTANKVTPTVEKATANTYKGIMDVVENKKSLLNNFKKSEGTGKDPIRVIAENPDYSVKINSEAKTIDATDAITHMKRDIEDYSGIRDNVLATADQTLPQIPTNNIIRDVSSKFNAKNYSTYLDEGEKAVKEVITKLQTLKKYNPDTISRVNLNEIRKGLDETINSFTDTKLKDRMRADLRTVFKETLENSIPESGLLKELNAKIGDIIDASKFVETRLNGTKVKGGGLTDLAMKATGANIGAAGAGGVLGGVPGAVAGYAISDFLSKQLIKNAINNPFDRAVLEKLKQARPDVVKRAEEYIKSTSQGRTSKTEVAPKLLQQSLPNSTPKEIKGKGIKWNSGFVDPAVLFKKNPAKINNIVKNMTNDDATFLKYFTKLSLNKKITKEAKSSMDDFLGQVGLTAKTKDEQATIANMLLERFNSKK